MSSRWWSERRLAAAGITAQFLALIRTLSEVFRIKHFMPDRYALPAIEPMVGAALFTAALVAVAVAASAIGRHRTALTIAAANIAALFAYRVIFM